MDYRREKDTIYLRIDKGEPLLETIKDLAQKEKIEAGYFHGIGACDQVVISTYLADKAEYKDHTITGMIEMVSLAGNISTNDSGQPTLHSHAVFSYLKDDDEIAVVAGHLKEADISYTGEIILELAEEKISRMFDQKAGIDIWKLS
ncbi:MAG: DUF296 domain-containing protein [Clostridiaceae bacterium]|nr:DUF296 domain-containing protein [Clostridiaceae bacterium]